MTLDNIIFIYEKFKNDNFNYDCITAKLIEILTSKFDLILFESATSISGTLKVINMFSVHPEFRKYFLKEYHPSLLSKCLELYTKKKVSVNVVMFIHSILSQLFSISFD